MQNQWIGTGNGKFTHNSICGLFAERCRSGKYIVYMTTPNYGRRLWCQLVAAEEFANYKL